MASLADSKFNLEWMKESFDSNDPVLHVPSHAKIGPFYFYPATYGRVASLHQFLMCGFNKIARNLEIQPGSSIRMVKLCQIVEWSVI